MSPKKKILDGRKIAAELKEKLAKRIKVLEGLGIKPGLAIIRVGSNPASQVYISSKKRQCQSIGIRSFEHVLPETVPQEKIISLIHHINSDPEIHGLILQLPLPEGLNKDEILLEIAPEKDVDGLHPLNLGYMFAGMDQGFVPCTPRGCLHLIHYVQTDLKGMHAVVIGASNLVGKPMAQLLLREGCTVSILHSKSKNPRDICSQADIIVAAAGSPLLVKQDWVKPGAIVIDVGINRLVSVEGTPFLVGDVDAKNVLKKAAYLSPVPGGVGPMTVTYLLDNTVLAAERSAAQIVCS